MKSRKLVFLFAAAMMLALTYVPSASAGGKTIWENPENPCNKVSLSGSLRFRYEQNSVDAISAADPAYSGANTTDRDRQRVRVRLGMKINTGHGVTAGARFTTDGGLDSQNATLAGTLGGGGPDNSARYSLNVDRAYVMYGHGSGFWVIGGKWGNPAKQLSGAWFNGNHSPEGIALGFGTAVGDGKLGVSVAQLILAERNFNKDGDMKATQIEGQWGGSVGGDVKLNVGVTNLTMDFATSGLDNISYTLIVLGAKWNQISGGVEFFTSDDKDKDTAGGESSDNGGLVVHVRYKINDMLGVRAYMYDMGDDAAPLPQTDFGQRANFTGTRIQLDVKAAGVNMDFRYYTQKIKNDNAAYLSGNVDHMDNEDSHTRIQANFVVGF